MNQQQLEEKYSRFENINALFLFLSQTIKWLCTSFGKDEKIGEIFTFDSSGGCCRLLREDAEKICRVHKFLAEFKVIMKPRNFDKSKNIAEFLELTIFLK